MPPKRSTRIEERRTQREGAITPEGIVPVLPRVSAGRGQLARGGARGGRTTRNIQEIQDNVNHPQEEEVEQGGENMGAGPEETELPAPPMTNLVAVMANQTELLRAIAQGM